VLVGTSSLASTAARWTVGAKTAASVKPARASGRARSRRIRQLRYHRRRAMSSDEPTEFTAKFRLTRADARATLWFAAREWVGWLVGLALLTLACATWRGLAPWGPLFALVIPIGSGLKFLSLLNKTNKLVERFGDRELAVSINREGLLLDTGLTKSLIRWPALRRIVRDKSIWVFYARNDKPFFIPTAAIPVEARALVARWAGELGVRLT
jgi:hypothetical protein